jgi:hypothetical protein
VTEAALEALAAQMERLLGEFAEMRREMADMQAAMLHIKARQPDQRHCTTHCTWPSNSASSRCGKRTSSASSRPSGKQCCGSRGEGPR